MHQKTCKIMTQKLFVLVELCTFGEKITFITSTSNTDRLTHF